MNERDDLLELIEEKWLTDYDVILACLKYMTLDQVKEMMEINEFDVLYKDYTSWVED